MEGRNDTATILSIELKLSVLREVDITMLKERWHPSQLWSLLIEVLYPHTSTGH